MQLCVDASSAATTQTNQINSQVTHNSSIAKTSYSHTTYAKSSVGSPVRVSFSDINKAANTLKMQIVLNHKLPIYVTVSNRNVTTPQFLDILTSGIIKSQYGLKTPVIIRKVYFPKSSYETIKTSSLSKASYLKMASTIRSFININHRIPSYVRANGGRMVYGNVLYNFCKIFNFVSSTNRLPNFVTIRPWKLVLLGKPIYITSDNIVDKDTDNARINSIVSGLISNGFYAKNWGLGPDSHYNILLSNIPQDALIIDIYGGACAGTLFEMGKSYYLSAKGNRKVYSIFWPPALDITGLPFLRRAHDDNFTPLYGSGKPGAFTSAYDVDHDGKIEVGLPGREDGLAHPDQYLHSFGYYYLYSGDINAIVAAISRKAIS